MNTYFLKKIIKAIACSGKAFRKIDSPKLVMTLLVKNEEKMLEENLLFHKSMGVDEFVVTDNNSTDGTMDIIRKYQQKGWIKEVIVETATNYEQKKWVDRMIWIAKTRCHADWVMNVDADELWYAPSGSLKSELSQTRANVLNCKVYSVYPDEERPFWEWDKTVRHVADIEKYDLSPYSIFARQNNKVMHRADGYIQISMGNHKVKMLPMLKENSEIRVYHYNIRGKRQFLEKMINGGKQLEQNKKKHGGRHWRYYYQLYKQGLLEQEYSRVIGENSFERLMQDGYIHNDRTILEYFKQKLF